MTSTLLKKIMICSLLLCGGCSLIPPRGSVYPQIEYLKSIIPTDSKVKKIKKIEYQNPRVLIIKKKLENGVIIRDIDYDIDGTIDEREIIQKFPNGVLIRENDVGADGTIERRNTFYPDGLIVLEEIDFSTGKIKRSYLR